MRTQHVEAANAGQPSLPTRVPRASIDFTDWLEQQRERAHTQDERQLPDWVVCNRAEDARADGGYGPDPDAVPPEWARPCELCGTSCYVKGAFVTRHFRVIDWVCFRRRGGRDVVIHPGMFAEIEAAAGPAATEVWLEVWEWISEMRDWLADNPAHSAGLPEWPMRLWRKRQREVSTN